MLCPWTGARMHDKLTGHVPNTAHVRQHMTGMMLLCGPTACVQHASCVR
jgi:NAD-dependent dihydropyrimidine dehydrogenase PreA subunit